MLSGSGWRFPPAKLGRSTGPTLASHQWSGLQVIAMMEWFDWTYTFSEVFIAIIMCIIAIFWTENDVAMWQASCVLSVLLTGSHTPSPSSINLHVICFNRQTPCGGKYRQAKVVYSYLFYNSHRGKKTLCLWGITAVIHGTEAFKTFQSF